MALGERGGQRDLPRWGLYMRWTTYKIPKPIKTDKEILVDSFIFRFQNMLAGNSANRRSTTEQTAVPQSVQTANADLENRV
jgi:hypothetical protein